MVNDPELDKLMDASTGAATLEDRGNTLKKVLQYAYDQAYFMPLYRYVDSYAVSKRVLNWAPPTDELVVVGVKTDVAP